VRVVGKNLGFFLLVDELLFTFRADRLVVENLGESFQISKQVLRNLNSPLGMVKRLLVLVELAKQSAELHVNFAFVLKLF